MPEFHRLENRSGQVEWDGGSIQERDGLENAKIARRESPHRLVSLLEHGDQANTPVLLQSRTGSLT